MEIPTSYVDGHAAARKVHPELADLYVKHTMIGDPLADAVVEELAETTTPAQLHSVIRRTLDNWDDLPDGTPQSLRDLIASCSELPEWYDPDLAMDATKAFLRNSDMVMGGLIAGAIVEGFSTLISKSFRIRSRITQNGVRRLKQNILQLIDQFMPGGMFPGNDGWRLCLRVRLVHAQVRMLLKESDEWDSSVYGVPLSAAHMALGSAAFSGRLMDHVANLGGDFSAREREGYVHVWRYSGLIMGVPEEIMFRNDEESLRLFHLAAKCEPPPDFDAILMANSIINSAPIVLGVEDTEGRRALAKWLYQVTRELIGDELAEAFNFPPARRLRKEVLTL